MIEKLVFSQFIEHIPQFVWWKDLDSIFLGCNENVANYVGLKNAQDIVGLTDFDIYENKKDAEFVRKIDQEIIQTGKSQLNFEEYLTLPNIGKRWLSTSKTPLYDRNKNIIGTIGWFNDITEIKELRLELDEKSQILFNYSLELNNTLKKLETANTEIEHFTYTTSQDLKTPIEVIKNLSNLILHKKEKDCSKEVYDHVNSIARSIESMDKTVNDVLSYGLSGSKNELAVAVDLNEIVALKILDLNSNFHKGEKVNYEFTKNNVKCYQKLIGLLFYNLILNGLTFNDSATPIVEIESTEDSNFHYITVKDNGVGIKKEEQKFIFKPFKKGTVRKSIGSGLGLSTCKRVVTLHKGKIWIEESSPGRTIIKFSISKHL